ncbi:hypothetical protein N4G58_10910 [Edwardsiella piscicida]|nr:hypothetical protein N4G58_10910 [Edwardsiella piscicida]
MMGQLIPALLAGGACALVAFLVLPARTSRRYRRRLPRVLLHQLGRPAAGWPTCPPSAILTSWRRR